MNIFFLLSLESSKEHFNGYLLSLSFVWWDCSRKEVFGLISGCSKHNIMRVTIVFIPTDVTYNVVLFMNLK